MSSPIASLSAPTISFRGSQCSPLPSPGTANAGHSIDSATRRHALTNDTAAEGETEAAFPTCENQDSISGPSEETSRLHGVLIVEDEPLLRKALSIGFRNRGFDVWLATDGAEGVEVYQQFYPLIDVVLSDVRMPVLDGPRTLDALRAINPFVRFCFMTGDARAVTRVSLSKRGALRVFEKPLPSVAEVAQELWELATCPNDLLSQPDLGNRATTDPNRPALATHIRELPAEGHFFEWAYGPLLTSISRIRSMLSKPSLPKSSGMASSPNKQ